MNGPYVNDIIRLQLSKGAPPSDQVSGSTPSFYAGSPLTVALSDTFLSAGIDASDILSVTLAFRPVSNLDAGNIAAATVTPQSTGWNSNAAQVAGQPLVPGYAQYSAGGSYTLGVQVGGIYNWVVNSNDTALVVATGTNLVPASTNYVAGSYTLTVPGSGYYYFIKGVNDTSVAGASPATLSVTGGFYVSGTSVTLTGSGTSAVTAQVFAAVLAPGSNLVNYSSLGSTLNYSGGAATLSGLTTGAHYYWLKGANDTGCAGLTASGYFTAAGTTAALTGSGITAVTAEVYPASLGANIVNGAVSYPATSVLAPTGSNLAVDGGVTPATSGLVTTASTAYGANPANAHESHYSAVVTGQNYGTLTLIGLTPGATYIYILGSAELSVGGSVAGQTAQTGYFTAISSSVLLTGAATNSVTAIVYATTEAATSFILSGLTIGQTYFWTKGANDATCGALSASGFFTATAQQVTLTGVGGDNLTCFVQQATQTPGGSFVAAANTVTFTGTASASVTAGLTGNVGWNLMNDQLCLVQLTAAQTALFGTPTGGGSTPYAILVTATSSAVTGTIVFDGGTVNAVDAGQASGTPTSGNLVPSAASYSVGGSYTLTGLMVGYNYWWSPGVNDTNITIGSTTITGAGTILATASSATLTGTPSAAVTATVYAVNTNPLVQTVQLVAGAVGFTVANLSLPLAPITAVAFVSCPVGGVGVMAWLTQSSLATTGASFVLSSPVPTPATGYVATVFFYI